MEKRKKKKVDNWTKLSLYYIDPNNINFGYLE